MRTASFVATKFIIHRYLNAHSSIRGRYGRQSSSSRKLSPASIHGFLPASTSGLDQGCCPSCISNHHELDWSINEKASDEESSASNNPPLLLPGRTSSSRSSHHIPSFGESRRFDDYTIMYSVFYRKFSVPPDLPPPLPIISKTIDTLMRFPTFPTIIRTFYAISNVTKQAFPVSPRIPYTLARGTTLRSLPTIPFLGSFFSTSNSSRDMSYPLKKSDDEWRVLLNKGGLLHLLYLLAVFRIPVIEARIN